ncbi:ArgE/DapE family deacylase [Roseovarius sp. SCSIO 43702]|uniref:ArgE/DapE family deacylase n=1 Tax=Roseovarius sp. SCSIO 43702 TaxID=2823043 RepID=UPI001C72FBE9|nr:ArgE/DapE family deacylase [Roseovarius sp. SCSIO 43702]QYX56418.1 ArgE/DapE family deacylase [Roseovarius sp. SCSIO 43702]
MTLDKELRDRILKAVEDGFDEQVAFTRDLVRMPSLRGREHAVQDYLFTAMKDRGLAMDRFAMDRDAIERHPGGSKFSDQHSEAPIVVGIHRPAEEKGRSLILQSHVDVVPEGLPEMWSDPPFSGAIKGDWMYGRGAGDMKAGAAANIFAFDALARIGLRPAATVYVQSVVEEESTGNGALQTFLEGYTADAVLIPEPEDEKLVRANTGVLWFQVKLRGVPVHVREMGEGANAIDAAYRVAGALREMEARWNDEKGEHPHFEEEPHPINLNIGKIAGGDWASSVPSWCTIDVRVSIYPGRSAEDAAREIESCVADFAKTDAFLSNNPPEVVFNGFFAEGYVLEPGSEAEAVLGRAHEAAIGAPLESFVTAGYLDTRVYALYNKIPALCYGPISQNIHGIDERVNLPSVKRITQAMALFIAEWCGVEDAR